VADDGNWNIEEIERAFSAAMAERGYGDHHVPANSGWNRFAFPDNRPGRDSGSAILDVGETIVGTVRDFRVDEPSIFVWQPNGAIDPALATEYDARARERAAELKALREKVREESEALFHSLPAASPDHPYLVRKHIRNPHPLRQDGNALVVPIFNAATGEFQAIQRIWPDGGKFFPKGATVAGGCVIPASNGLERLDQLRDPIVYCEGYANAAAIDAAEAFLPIACLSSNNLIAVAEAIRRRFPRMPAIFAADDETKAGKDASPGIDAAYKAARKIFEARVALPSRKDFSDVFVLDGPEEVKRQICAAVDPPPVERVEVASTEEFLNYIRTVTGESASSENEDQAEAKPEEQPKTEEQPKAEERPKAEEQPKTEESQSGAKSNGAQPAKWRAEISVIDISNWDNEPVPEQEWAVQDRIPIEKVALFSGEGAAGKSLIQLQLSVACVLGRDWFGVTPRKGPAIFIDAEDDEKIIHKRLADVLHYYGVRFASVKNDLHLVSLTGKESVLGTLNRRANRIVPTLLYNHFLEMAGDLKPTMIGIASSADVFAGSEIDRSQVQQFIALLTRLAMVAHGSVVLISHPSLIGINTESGLSGSTQWHNSVRARFYLRTPKPTSDDAPDTNLRQIEFKKSNYGRLAESIGLEYRNGLFLPIDTPLDAALKGERARQVFLALLTRFNSENRNVTANNAPGYAPKMFAEEAEARNARLSKRDLAEAMRRLLLEKKIRMAPYGKPSKPVYRLEVSPPPEEEAM